MKVFNDPKKLQKWAWTQRLAGRKIALVPTMGALHEGHLSLIAAAKKKGADEIIVMNEGRIVERGRHDELIALDGYYRKLHDMQAL